MTGSFGSQFMHRRIPQILGMYVAATWVAIEMGEWMSERFGMAEWISSYLFIGMLSMLPSVALLAWGHGAPGKDRWSRLEMAVLPMNVLLAVLVISVVFEPTETIAATEIVEVLNEQGGKESFEVPLAGYHQEVLAMFWQSSDADPDDQWLDYGLPAVLAQDLSRSPLLNVVTPFDSDKLRENLEHYGFERGLGAGKAVSLQIARQGLYKLLLMGRWEVRDDGLFALTARLFTVESGGLLAELSRQGNNSFELVDQISSDIRQELARAGGGKATLVTDLSLNEHFSDSIEAIKLWVQARVERSFDNDYENAIGSMVQALKLDPSFAAANGQLGLYYRFNGQNSAGIVAIDQALRHDYKLSTRELFFLRANRYAMLGDTPKAVRVLEMWVEIEPQSATALRLLGSNYLLLEDHLDQASLAFAKIRKLDPHAMETYLVQAQIEQQRGDFVAAGVFVDRYLARRPEDFRGMLIQAIVREQSGDLDGARESYENASILQTHEIDAELGLLGLDLKQERFELMDQRLELLLAKHLTMSQQVAVQALKMKRLAYLGRLSEALELASELDQMARSFMIPLLRILEFGVQRATFLAQRGEQDNALALMDELATQVESPMDGIVLYIKLAVLEIADEHELFRQAMVQVRSFRQQVDIPMLDPFIQRYEALVQSWDGEISQAIATHGNARIILQKSLQARLQPELLLEMDVQMALYLNQSGQADKAIELLKTVLELDPSITDARLELANLLYEQGRLDEAGQYLSALLALWNQADSEFLDYQRALKLQSKMARPIESNRQ